jgi:hypothetical protein
MRAIADKADRLIVMHVLQSHDACAAVAAEPHLEEPCVVAAAQTARSRKGKRPQQKPLGCRIDLSKRGQDQGAPLRTSMCYYHAKFGEQAKFCEERCSWPEN